MTTLIMTERADQHRQPVNPKLQPTHRTSPTTNAVSTTSAGLRPAVVPPRSSYDPPTSGVARPTNQNVNSATTGVSKPAAVTPATTGVSRGNTGTPSTGEVQRATSHSVYTAPTGVLKFTATAASGGVFEATTAVSTTGSVAKPTSQYGYYPVTSEVSEPATVTPATLEVSRSNAGTLPTVTPGAAEVQNVTSQSVYPASTGVSRPTTVASAEVLTPTTAAPTSSTREFMSPSSSTLSDKEVKSTLPIYPDLPEAIDDVIFTRNQFESKLRVREGIRRVHDWSQSGSVKTGGAQTPSEGVNSEPDRSTSCHPIDYSSSGRVKSQTSSESFVPSFPEYSLFGRFGASSQVSNENSGSLNYRSGSVENSGSTVDPHGSRAKDEYSDCAGNSNEDLYLKACEPDIGLPSRNRDSSPVDSESWCASRQSGFSGNRGRPKRNGNKPRKPYGDVVTQIKAERKTEIHKIDPHKNTIQWQFKANSDGKNNQRYGRPKTNTLEDRFRSKNVDELNDLIKKEFGSLGGPTHDLPIVLGREKMFSGRNTLYVRNLPFNVTLEDVIALMAPFGEIVIKDYNAEKKFGFVTFKHRYQAENAQRNLDRWLFKGWFLRVRFANPNICFKVHNLDAWVTNELLKKAFSVFGEVERAEVVAKAGKSTGEGYLEFSDRRAGKMALKACVENCFLLTSSLRPVILREINPDDCLIGYSERNINRNEEEYQKSREVGPRFVAKGSKENYCANLWKRFYTRRKREEEELAKRMQQEEKLLEEQIRTMMS